ncbi:MAG: hypothetical protein WC890_03875 [Candidatus Margulisiibacteriota bacterium]
MTNEGIIGKLKWFYDKWFEVMLRPIYFFTVMKEESWQDDSLSFLLASAWISAFFASIMLFIVSYVPIGQYMIAGIAGFKFLVILPVLCVLAFNFFMITFLIMGGMMVCGFFVAQAICALFIHSVASLWQGKGELNRMLQSMFYSNAAFMTVNLVFILMLVVKFAGLGFPMFKVGYNLIYFLTLLFVYGLWSIIIRKNYDLPKWKSFIIALIPILVLLLFGLVFDKIALSKFEPWVS